MHPRSEETGPALRWLRALVVAAMALSVGTIAHASAGGTLPGDLTMLGFLLLLTAVSAAALARPASYAVLAALVVGGQMAVHTVLTALSGHPGAHPTAQPSEGILVTVPQGGVRGQLSVVDTGTQVVAGPALPHWLQHLADDLTGAGLLMALAHAVAAGAVAGWLLVGERALAALLLMLRGRLDLALHAFVPVPSAEPAGPGTIHPAGSRGAEDLLDRLRRAASHGPTARRGPPALRLTTLSSPTI